MKLQPDPQNQILEHRTSYRNLCFNKPSRVVLPAPKIYKHWLDQGVTKWLWIKQTMLGILATPFQGGN